MDQTLIIGLGNPDPALEETYHNVGWRAVEWIARRAAENGTGGEVSTHREGTPKFKHHQHSFSYAKIGDRIFILPLVFMNESGQAVHDAMRAFGADTENIIVIHDDSDLTVGSFKYAVGGGSAGHKGIRSIIDHLHTENFARIRIGIREKDEARRRKAGDFVLSPIVNADKLIFGDIFEKIFNSLKR